MRMNLKGGLALKNNDRLAEVQIALMDGVNAKDN